MREVKFLTDLSFEDFEVVYNLFKEGKTPEEIQIQTGFTLPQIYGAIAEYMHSIFYLRGLGKELWADQDAQEYIDEMRDEWDDPERDWSLLGKD